MPTPGARALVWLLVDGLPAELARRFAARHPTSHMARCLRGEPAHQARALLPLQPNCQTPPSLFSIWSGLPSETHKITGYDMPSSADTSPLALADGFSQWPREPLMAWDRLAAAGRRLRLYAMPFVQPQRLGTALRAHTRIYGPWHFEPALLRHGQRWELSAPCRALEVHAGPDAVELRPCGGAASEALVVPLHQVKQLAVGRIGNANGVTVACVPVDGQPALAVYGLREATIVGPAATKGSRPAALACNPGVFYQRGQLGRRLGEGGQGDAEAVLVELMQVVHQSFADEIRAQLHCGDADVLFAYYPVLDLLCHQLLKHVHPDTGTPQQRAVCEPLFDRVLGWVDELLGDCRQAWPGAQVLAHSDHGMLPVLHDVHANVALHQLGWLAFDDRGTIDLDRTVAFMHPADNGLVVFDTAALRDRGLTPPQVIDALRAQLPGPLQQGWQAIDGPAAPLGVHWQAHQYLQPPPHARWRTGRAAQVVLPSQKGGDHTVACDAPWLQGMAFALGSGFGSLPESPLALEALLPLALKAVRLDEEATA